MYSERFHFLNCRHFWDSFIFQSYKYQVGGMIDLYSFAGGAITNWVLICTFSTNENLWRSFFQEKVESYNIKQKINQNKLCSKLESL